MTDREQQPQRPKEAIMSVEKIDASLTKERDNREAMRRSFMAAAEPLMQWLNDNVHPHHTVIVTPGSAELMSGEIAHKTDKFILD